MTSFKCAKFTPDSQEAKKPHAIQNSIFAFKRAKWLVYPEVDWSRINTNVQTKQTQPLHTNNTSNKACTLTTNCFTNAEQKPVLALSLFNFDDFSTLNAKL